MKLRRATTKDIDILFEWVNEPAVRMNSINKDKISFKEHKEWFLNKLINSKTFIYILEDKNSPVGQIRFEEIVGFYEIDYSIDKNYRGKGLGEYLIIKGMNLLYLDTNNKFNFKGKVLKENIASSKIFEKIGFIPVRKEVYENKTYLIYEK